MSKTFSWVKCSVAVSRVGEVARVNLSHEKGVNSESPCCHPDLSSSQQWFDASCRLLRLVVLMEAVGGGYGAVLGLVLLRLDSDTDSGNLLVPWLASSAQSRESGLRNTGNVGTFFPVSLGGVASVMGPSPSLHRNWN